MLIDGVSVTKEDGLVVCYIEEFSDQLKDLIREDLNRICYGKNRIDEDDLGHYSYKRTLKDFLKRYSEQSKNTQKGMMGEFISHLIINKVLPHLQTISVFFNKEDLSIRKGFDLNYIDLEGNSIWYGEVKSGEITAPSVPDDKNKSLINLAKNGIIEFLSGQRPNLWDSVIVDASLSFAQKEKKTVQDLLKNDIAQIEENTDVKKNVILVSVLFHDVQNKTTTQSVKDHLATIVSEGHFLNVILFCIQKTTYSKIEEFLNQEAI